MVSETTRLPFLGGLTPARFLSEYWQKKPLFIPAAFPGFQDPVTMEDVVDLAQGEDLQSRLIIHDRKGWRLEHGPLAGKQIARAQRAKWAILVQGLNLLVPEADALLQRFNFIPYARLDDVMVSYSGPQGGVGPHFDSYDVFLLQGTGQKKWQISRQSNLSLIPDAPLKILAEFHPEQEWTLGPGDMLYLPPQWAHWGIALNDCLTFSIGFRAPSAQELTEQFLGYLQEHIRTEGMYADPDLLPTHQPAEISPEMVDQVEELLSRIRWTKEDIGAFLGSYLSEPKPHVFFDPPETPPAFSSFQTAARRTGIVLDPKTQMLYWRQRLYINGSPCENVAPSDGAVLMHLANHRRLRPGELPDSRPLTEVLYEWLVDGYLHLADGHPPESMR